MWFLWLGLAVTVMLPDTLLICRDLLVEMEEITTVMPTTLEVNGNFSTSHLTCWHFFLKRFFVPRTWSGCYNQISEFFLLQRFGVVWVFIDLPGVVIGQHIHPHHSLGSIHLDLLSCWVESTHPFAARDVDSRPSVILHPSGGHNCLIRCWLQMFETTGLCGYGNQTREHQSGHHSSYLLWTSVLNFSDLTI